MSCERTENEKGQHLIALSCTEPLLRVYTRCHVCETQECRAGACARALRLDKHVVNDQLRYAAVNTHFVRARASLQEIKIDSARTDQMLAACKMLGVAEGGAA
jgi:hypothetical protein